MTQHPYLIKKKLTQFGEAFISGKDSTWLSASKIVQYKGINVKTYDEDAKWNQSRLLVLISWSNFHKLRRRRTCSRGSHPDLCTLRRLDS